IVPRRLGSWHGARSTFAIKSEVFPQAVIRSSHTAEKVRLSTEVRRRNPSRTIDRDLRRVCVPSPNLGARDNGIRVVQKLRAGANVVHETVAVAADTVCRWGHAWNNLVLCCAARKEVGGIIDVFPRVLGELRIL